MAEFADVCGACKRSFSFGLPRCGFCHRTICGDCSVRIGASVFCGQTCSHAFYYGGDEDVEEGRSDADEPDE